MRKTNARRVGAMLVGLALVAAACGDDDDSGSSATTAAAPETTAGSETTAGATTTEAAATTTKTTAKTTTTTAGGSTTAAGKSTTTAATAAGGGGNGALEGMKGTTPLVELSQDFKNRLLAINPQLTDYNYAAETYDAVTIIALAVEQAKDDGIAYASKINGITRTGDKCTDYKS